MILIIQPATAGLELMATAKQMGLGVVVFSADSDERRIAQNYLAHIDELIQVDTNSFEALNTAFQALPCKDKIRAILPGFENYVALAAQLAHEHGLPSVAPTTAQALRNKYLARQALSRHGVAQPQHHLINNESDLFRYREEFIFPCVIKPIDCSGSVRVSKADDFAELCNFYRELSTDTWTEMGHGIGQIALVETLLTGLQYSVEGVVSAGDVIIHSITQKYFGGAPYFVEIAHRVPAMLSKQRQQQISDYIQQVIKALAFNIGAFHIEIGMSEEQPMLIEFAGRLAGGKICNLIQHVFAVNPAREMIAAYLQAPLTQSPTLHAPQACAGIHYFTLPHHDRYARILGLEQLQNLPGFIDFGVLIPPGESIPPLTSFLARVAYVMVEAPDFSSLEDRLSRASQSLSFI